MSRTEIAFFISIILFLPFILLTIDIPVSKFSAQVWFSCSIIVAFEWFEKNYITGSILAVMMGPITLVTLGIAYLIRERKN